MLAILDLIDAILDYKKSISSNKRRIRRARRTSRGFVLSYYR